MRESGSVTLTWSSARTPALSGEMMRYVSYLYQPARQGSAGRSVVDAGTCQDRRRTLIPRRFSQYIVVAGGWQRDDAELDYPRYTCSRSGACQVGKLATLCRSGAVPRTSRFALRCGASRQLGPPDTLNLSSDYLVVSEKVASIAAKAHAGSVFKVGWGERREPQHQSSAE